MALDREIQACKDNSKSSIVCKCLKDVCCIWQYQSSEILAGIRLAAFGDVGGLSHREGLSNWREQKHMID